MTKTTTKVFFEHVKTGKKYQLLRTIKNADTGDIERVVLRGEHADFEEPFDKDRFKALGYVLKKEDA